MSICDNSTNYTKEVREAICDILGPMAILGNLVKIWPQFLPGWINIATFNRSASLNVFEGNWRDKLCEIVATFKELSILIKHFDEISAANNAENKLAYFPNISRKLGDYIVVAVGGKTVPYLTSEILKNGDGLIDIDVVFGASRFNLFSANVNGRIDHVNDDIKKLEALLGEI